MTLRGSFLHGLAFAAGVAASTGALMQTPAPATPQTPAIDVNQYYAIGPDSTEHDGVPKGEIKGPYYLPSQAYPGTQHTYWLHVPAQYDPAVEASLMIFQDGQAFKDMNGVIRAP